MARCSSRWGGRETENERERDREKRSGWCKVLALSKCWPTTCFLPHCHPIMSHSVQQINASLRWLRRVRLASPSRECERDGQSEGERERESAWKYAIQKEHAKVKSLKTAADPKSRRRPKPCRQSPCRCVRVCVLMSGSVSLCMCVGVCWCDCVTISNRFNRQFKMKSIQAKATELSTQNCIAQPVKVDSRLHTL